MPNFSDQQLKNLKTDSKCPSCGARATRHAPKTTLISALTWYECGSELAGTIADGHLLDTRNCVERRFSAARAALAAIEKCRAGQRVSEDELRKICEMAERMLPLMNDSLFSAIWKNPLDLRDLRIACDMAGMGFTPIQDPPTEAESEERERP